MRRHEMIRFRPNARRNTGTLRTATQAGRGVLQPGLSDVNSLRRRVRRVLKGTAGLKEGSSLQDRAAIGQAAHANTFQMPL